MVISQNKLQIGERIRLLRKAKGLTQAEFSESINISVNFLSEVETGKKSLSVENLQNLCRIHEISADYILFGHSEQSTEESEMIISELNTMPKKCYPYILEYLRSVKKMILNEKDISNG